MSRAFIVALICGVGVSLVSIVYADGPAFVAEEAIQPVSPPPQQEPHVLDAISPQHQHQEPVDTNLKVIHVNNAQATHIADIIGRLLMKMGSNNPIPQGWGNPKLVIGVDPASNSLLVNATPDMFKKIEALIDQLDVRPKMVQVELIIVETSKDKSVANNPDMIDKKTSKGFAKDSPVSVAQLKKELGLTSPGASVESRGVISKIDALEKAGRLRVVRRPRMVAISGQPAQLTIGRKEPHITGVSMSKFGEQSSINYREVGLVMTVKSRVSSDDAVTIDISLTESHIGPAHEGVAISKTKQRTVWSPRIKSISAQSVVRLKSGQATELGGLITGGNTDEPEQLILVTATVVKD